MRNILVGLSVLGGCLLAACSADEASVGGRLVGNDNRMVYLERVLPGSQQIVDSVSTDDKGYFNFKVKLPAGQPTIYNLLCRQERIPLLVAPREKVKIHSVGNITRNYTVEGSEGSSEMRRLGDIFYYGNQRLDSIFNTIYDADVSVNEDLRREVAMSYRSAYFKLKTEHITFIVSNPGSLVAIYALYQRLPNDDLFNGTNDIIYYRLVADSTAKYYPDSPYVAALQKEVENMGAQQELARMLEEKLSEEGSDFPDFELQDMNGKSHKLSSLKGKVILLDFWTVSSADNRLLNAELKDIYARYKDRGFEVYQVGVDRDRSEWVLAVLDQKLPWISVNDFKGSSSLPVMLYNVQSVPANFIIDRDGDIAGRDLYGESLEKRLNQLL